MKPCEACKKFHYGFCKDRSISLTKRIKAGKWVDGDRVPDYWLQNLEGTSEEILKEIGYLEREIARLRRICGSRGVGETV